MEKYGVEEKKSGDKTAQEDTEKCSACGSKLRNSATTGVLLCPKCGSEPFEG